VREHIIWNNTETKLQENTIYSAKWHEKGLNDIDQLFDLRAKAFYRIIKSKTNPKS
jgi:hypothetical protein